MSKLIYGVGVNDATYKPRKYSLVDGSFVLDWSCPYYQAWTRMLERCYSPSFLSRRPTYAGCSVVNEWLVFSAFKEWMASKDWDGMQLDKDILNPNNKIYGPKSCVFVSGNLNTFLVARDAERGSLPLGVTLAKHNGKFKAYCSNPWTHKNECLGTFDSPDIAHRAWKSRKHQHACRYADMQTDPRIAEALRSRFA